MTGALNFILTNRLPRRLATRLVGLVSHTRLWPLAPLALLIWRLCCRVDLRDAAQPRFASLHDGFVRALRPGARPFEADPATLSTPCDALLGAHGPIGDGTLLQVKGMAYRLEELVGTRLAAAMAGGRYVTLRLTAGMYHRFHAPADLTIETVEHVPGDCRNVNGPALARVPRLYCRNERAVIGARLADGAPLVLVPVAAILVAGIRLHPFGLLRGGGRRGGLALARTRGEELGWFEHGSTIVLLAAPGWETAPGIGPRIRAGQPLLRRVVIAP